MQIHQIRAGNKVNRIEDGPVGGTPIYFGSEKIGQMLDAPLPKTGIWNLARISDLSLAQTSYQLTKEKRCWLPTMKRKEAFEIEITTVARLNAKIGPYHADINYSNADGSVRGPFDIKPITEGDVPTYPVLWAHEAECEKTLSFDGDSEGLPKSDPYPGTQKIIDKKVDTVSDTASYCHFNQNFRFTSQSTGMQFTPRKTIGGRAWTSIGLSSMEHEKALVLWGNTSIGLLLHWWHANKQQSGRGNIGVTALESLPVLDINSLPKKQLKQAAKIFDDFAKRELLPFFEIDKDQVRQELDEKFFGEVLQFEDSILQTGGPLELLRKKLAQEPSIRGGK
jgi:hypothetical protein